MRAAFSRRVLSPQFAVTKPPAWTGLDAARLISVEILVSF